MVYRPREDSINGQVTIHGAQTLVLSRDPEDTKASPDYKSIGRSIGGSLRGVLVGG